MRAVLVCLVLVACAPANAHQARVICSYNGHEAVIWTDSHGRELNPVPTGHRCAGAGAPADPNYAAYLPPA